MTLTRTQPQPRADLPWDQLPSPCYVLDERRLKRNLELIHGVAGASGAKLIVAFKGFAMWSSFDLVRRYVAGATASSLHEALLAREELGGEVHVYAAAYSQADFPQLLALADHLTFNSFSQWERFRPQVEAARQAGQRVSIGIRVNPEYAEVGTALYNPSMPFSRLGVTRAEFRPDVLDGVDGLHFHTLCENGSDTLERVLEVFERNFGEFLPRMTWVNFGGGHLMTREGYDLERLVRVIKNFREKWNVEVILEPGSAYAWQTGWLISSVLDVIRNEKDIAMLDVSVSAHMPDVLEMPYRPQVLGAALPGEKPYDYLLGGTTCLSGDVAGAYSFDAPLKVGDRVVFDDMIHYTMVKTTFFNGVKHPSIGIWRQDGHKDGHFRLVREFGYQDYKNKLS